MSLIIRPWSLPYSGGANITVPALPFPYMLRTVTMIPVGAAGFFVIGMIRVYDGAGAELFRTSSETLLADGGAIACFAVGTPRGSGGQYWDTVASVPVRYNAHGLTSGGVGVEIAHGAIPPDFWVMPQMRVELSFSGSIPVASANLIIGIPLEAIMPPQRRISAPAYAPAPRPRSKRRKKR